MHFLSYEKPGEEDYGDFDLFFYSQLVDARESILKMLQDRSLSIHHRMALALAISHDMQAHVDRREMFSCEDIPKKYESETARKYTKERLEAFEKAADGKATKIIIPSEIQSIAGLVKSLAEVGTDKVE